LRYWYNGSATDGSFFGQHDPAATNCFLATFNLDTASWESHQQIGNVNVAESCHAARHENIRKGQYGTVAFRMQLPKLTWMASLLPNSIPRMVCLLPSHIVLNCNLEKWIEESSYRTCKQEGEESKLYVMGVTISNLVDNTTNPEPEENHSL
jgi:hypothetical protein